MKKVILVFLILPLGLLSLHPTEYQVKTALIFNFLRFVELKEDRIINNEIHLCSFKNNPLNNEVKNLNKRVVGDKTIIFAEIYSENEIGGCSVLLVDKRDEKSLKKMIEQAYKYRILLIGDTDGYAELGVVINMFIEDEKVRFEINLEAANKSDVKISSRLLSIAKIVKILKK